MQVGSSVVFEHGPADSCGHELGAFAFIPHIHWSLLVDTGAWRPKCQSSQPTRVSGETSILKDLQAGSLAAHLGARLV